MEATLFAIADRLALVIDAAAVLVASGGALEAAIGITRVVARRGTPGARKDVWRRFAVWLVLALEFQLAADIVHSVVAPSWQDVGMLAAIAVIRTFLNIFLEKDLERVDGPRVEAVTP
jgi:uncharacterized membrane protein